MNRYKKELVVGLSIVIATIIFMIGVRYFQDLPLFRGTYGLYTRFEDASGLLNGNAVRVNGVRVGGVEDVRLDPETNKVLVTFHVDEDIAVPEGSHTEVAGIAALASVHLKLHLGPAANPAVEEGGYVPALRDANLLGRLTEQAPELVGQVDRLLSNANSTLEEAGEVFTGTDGDLRATLAAFRRTALTLDQLLQAEQVRLSRTLANFEAASSDLSGFTDARGDSLALAVDNLNRALRRLEGNMATLETTTDRLDSILLKIDRGDGTLGRMVNDPSLYSRLDSTVANLNALILDIQEDPSRYLKELDLVRIF